MRSDWLQTNCFIVSITLYTSPRLVHLLGFFTTIQGGPEKKTEQDTSHNMYM